MWRKGGRRVSASRVFALLIILNEPLPFPGDAAGEEGNRVWLFSTRISRKNFFNQSQAPTRTTSRTITRMTCHATVSYFSPRDSICLLSTNYRVARSRSPSRDSHHHRRLPPNFSRNCELLLSDG